MGKAKRKTLKGKDVSEKRGTKNGNKFQLRKSFRQQNPQLIESFARPETEIATAQSVSKKSELY